MLTRKPSVLSQTSSQEIFAEPDRAKPSRLPEPLGPVGLPSGTPASDGAQVAAAPPTEARDAYLSVGQSALQRPLLFGLVALVMVLIGTAVGYAIPVTYTAQARLIIGRTSGLAGQEVAGMALAVEDLASDYARLITSTTVTSQVERKLHVGSLPGKLSASPVPSSSVVTVTATAPGKRLAVNLANAGAAALTGAILKASNDTQAQLQAIAKDYAQAESKYESDSVLGGVLQSELNALLGNVSGRGATPVQQAQESLLQSEIARTKTEADAASLQAQVYSNQYDAALPPLAPQEELAQRVGVAEYINNDHKARTEAGFLAGLVVGLAAAFAVTYVAEKRRNLRAPG